MQLGPRQRPLYRGDDDAMSDPAQRRVDRFVQYILLGMFVFSIVQLYMDIQLISSESHVPLWAHKMELSPLNDIGKKCETTRF